MTIYIPDTIKIQGGKLHTRSESFDISASSEKEVLELIEALEYFYSNSIDKLDAAKVLYCLEVMARYTMYPTKKP